MNNDGYTECSSVPVPGTAPNGYENCCNLNVKTGVLTSQCCPIPDANGTHCVPAFKTSTCFVSNQTRFKQKKLKHKLFLLEFF